MDVTTGDTSEITSLVLPTAVAVTNKGAVPAMEFALYSGSARVLRIIG